VVTVKPKVYCMPKIFPSADELDPTSGLPIDVQSKLMDYCFVKSPANHILSTSQYLLLTIHQNVFPGDTGESHAGQGGYMRLWNTNDGRCVMISPLDMFNQYRRPYRVLLLSDYL
jgi:hypothetical protein